MTSIVRIRLRFYCRASIFNCCYIDAHSRNFHCFTDKATMAESI
ncbi:hypothetical protein A6M57_3210 [Staphylococcus pseudintermedius]|nr:hypothetical protein A6M57_3210 [Staphylococcus pseudintermedius]